MWKLVALIATNSENLDEIGSNKEEDNLDKNPNDHGGSNLCQLKLSCASMVHAR